MRTVAKYIKAFLCVMIVIAALVAPVTGFAPSKGTAVISFKNEIDNSSFSPQWTDSVLDLSNISDNEPGQAISKAIWDFSGKDAPVVLDNRQTSESFADVLNNNSDSGYDKLVQMARNGYADFGNKAVNSSAAGRDIRPVASAADSWRDSSGPRRNRRSSGSNSYTDVPGNPADAGNIPIDPGNGGSGGGGTTDPVIPPIIPPVIPPDDNPVVPAPPAIMLAIAGAVLIAKFKRAIK